MKSTKHISSPKSPSFTLPPTSTPTTVPILHSCLSLLISKLRFRGVFQCIPAEVYFTLVCSTPSIALPTLWPSIFSTAFNTYPYILFLRRCSIIPFPLTSFPEFHRVVLLLQTCSMYMFAYDHIWFCVHVYLLDLPSTYERKHAVFVFLSLAYFT
jgi:hypothetical protein